MHKVKLSSIAQFIFGQSPKSKYYSKHNGFPFLQGNKTFGFRYPEIDTYTTSITRIAPKNSILMSVRAPIGDLNLAQTDFCIGRGLMSISAIDNDNESLYYILKYNIHNLLTKGNGTTYDSITKDIINDFNLIIPSLSYHNVVKILKLIDHKIELNNKINSELESFAKMLYDYWFVQFDFPDEFGRPYKSSGGKMEWNEEIGRYIPANWNITFLDEICKMYQPKTLSKKDLSNNGKFFVYGANGIIGKYNEFNHIESEITISCRGTCGNVNRTLPKSWITGNAMVVKLVNSNIDNEYLYQMLRHTNINDIITGSVQAQVTRSNLEKLRIVKPNDDIILKYCSIIKDTVRYRTDNQLENQNLSNLRDFLLPLLMNGQVAIKD